MRVRALVAVLMLAGCPAAELVGDAGPPDAREPIERSLVLCLRVGTSFCKGMTECRPATSADGQCIVRWELYQCAQPEPLTETYATLCAAEWERRAMYCSVWWERGWFESTAPSCSSVLNPHD